MSFESLGLCAPIIKSLTEEGYTEPTPVQAEAIPAMLAGQDLLVSAQTGTGKTAAFMLPCLQKLGKPSTNLTSKGPRVLVLTPTRELAIQVCEATQTYGRYLPGLRVASIVGGMSYDPQRRNLARHMDVMVATPGRLMDHMQDGRVDFSRVEVLILDEADRMLDMGFVEVVHEIADQLPAVRQTTLFSATLDESITALARKLLKEPKRIQISTQKMSTERIAQHMHLVDDRNHKNKVICHMLGDAQVQQMIVFTATRRAADRLATELDELGHATGALHGSMRQNARNRTIEQMHRGNIRVLVATDVAARGIDVPGISHVVNYDLPKVAEDYVHRIGRTGRAGANGTAVSLVSPDDRSQIVRIERYLKLKIENRVIPGLEARASGSRPERSERREGRPERRGGGGGGFRGERRSSGGFSRRRDDRGPARDSASTSFPRRSEVRSEGRPENSRYEGRDMTPEQHRNAQVSSVVHAKGSEFTPRANDTRPERRPSRGGSWNQANSNPRFSKERSFGGGGRRNDRRSRPQGESRPESRGPRAF